MSVINDDKTNILVHDLLVYMTHLENAFNEIEESEEKNIIQEWLLLILENAQENLTAARIRNMALSQMLRDIENGKLRFPFNERPCRRTYEEFINWLKSVLSQNASLDDDYNINLKLNNEPKNRTMDIDEFEQFVSEDNRTYIAIRTLPNDGGVFGYVAISMGDVDDTKWLNSCGQPICTPIPSNLHLRVEQDDPDRLTQTPLDKRTDIKRVWLILKNRGPICLRNDSYDFYKVLYETIEQEMLALRNNDKCTHPYINKLLEYLEIDLNAVGISDHKLFCKIKMLSIIKKKIKFVLKEMKRRSKTLETTMLNSVISPIITLPPKCCYNFVTNALWNEISQQRPGTRYLDILFNEYPSYFFPKYLTLLVQQKKQILSSISDKYCKILDEMFVDLQNAIMLNMKKYKDAKWEWHLAHEIFNAYNKEKNFKDSLCAIENTTDETTESFFKVVLNEMEMAQNRLKSIVMKNDQMSEQLPKLRSEIADREIILKAINNQYEEKIGKIQKEINNEKRDIMKRENTIVDLQRQINELDS